MMGDAAVLLLDAQAGIMSLNVSILAPQAGQAHVEQVVVLMGSIGMSSAASTITLGLTARSAASTVVYAARMSESAMAFQTSLVAKWRSTTSAGFSAKRLCGVWIPATSSSASLTKFVTRTPGCPSLSLSYRRGVQPPSLFRLPTKFKRPVTPFSFSICQSSARQQVDPVMESPSGMMRSIVVPPSTPPELDPLELVDP